MSASKCGPAFGVVLVSPPVAKEETPSSIETRSERTEEMLEKVRQKLPNFNPISDAEIWIRARSLGLMDEQD